MITFNSIAQVPGIFNYQAVVRDNLGDLITNQNIAVKISILDQSANGSVLYTETHSVTSNEYGAINLKVGDGSSSFGNFSDIDWGTNLKFLKVEIDATGGSSYQLIGTFQLLSVPYAQYASNSEYADSSNLANFASNAMNSITSQSADMAGLAENANYADTATYAIASATALIADTATVAQTAITAINSDNATNSTHALTADSSEVAKHLDEDVLYFTKSDTLFAVKDRNGNIVFAVYPDGVKVYVNQGVKGNVGGFAVTGKNPTKAVETEYLVVTSDSTRVYVNNPVKGNVGGFAVTGRNPTKGTNEPIFISNKDSTRIFTQDTVSGFGVRNSKNGSVSSYMQLSPLNYFIGHESGLKTTGIYNNFFGYHSGFNNTTGHRNFFAGYEAGLSNTTGYYNVFIGNGAGRTNTTE